MIGTITVNEVAPRPHNSGHWTIEGVPYMSQYKAQLHSILDMLPRSIKLQPRVSGALMLNILGGAREDSHEELVDLTTSLYDDNMDVFLHLYGKSSKPGRKIGHITVTTHSANSSLERLAAPLINEVNYMREARLDAASDQLRLQESPAKKTSSRNADKPLVVVTMGSDSDLKVLRGAFEILEHFDVPYDLDITSAHRTPHRMVELGKTAAQRGIKVLIAAGKSTYVHWPFGDIANITKAGGAAHLPGMLASETTVPVIGVPVKATHLDGHDSLLSIVQMPRGCPVATVGINNSTNAALLAVKILGSSSLEYQQKMAQYMSNMSREVEHKAAELQEVGWKKYLDNQ